MKSRYLLFGVSEMCLKVDAHFDSQKEVNKELAIVNRSSTSEKNKLTVDTVMRIIRKAFPGKSESSFKKIGSVNTIKQLAFKTTMLMRCFCY